MKRIINWDKATVADIESDGLLDSATKIHVLSFKLDGKDIVSFNGETQKKRIKAFFQHHIDNKIPIVGHNFIGYDVPLVEKVLGIDLSGLLVIDTMALSWYLNIGRNQHGLDSFLSDYGIEKPAISDWNALTYKEYSHRCQEDVKINTALWEDLKSRLGIMYTLSSEKLKEGLVGGSKTNPDEETYLDTVKDLSPQGHITNLLTFLMFKMDCAFLQEKTRWKVDMKGLQEAEKELSMLVWQAKTELESVMPKVPQYTERREPAKMYKKDGTLTEGGKAWKEIQQKLRDGDVDEFGNKLAYVETSGKVKVLVKYNPPNINSGLQVKDFLFSHGWIPETFDYVRDKDAFDAWAAAKPEKGSRRGAWTAWKNSKPEDRKVPQISVEGEDGKELCPSVLKLAEEVPEISALEKYTTITHRRNMIKGMISSSKNGYLIAGVRGFTNTLRMKHRELVNLPSASKDYAQGIRSNLVADGDSSVLLGSDLSGLEDRTKHHFMIPIDPDYVNTMMADDYDPHIHMAYGIGLITEKEYLDFKKGIKPSHVSDARRKAKTLNYACLPVDTTEVLTDSGWKSYQEITSNDRVLSYNTKTGETEFCGISNRVFYEDREVLNLKAKRNWEAESTPDHRWLASRWLWRGGKPKSVVEYRRTDSLTYGRDLITSAPYEGGDTDLGSAFASILGWILAADAVIFEDEILVLGFSKAAHADSLWGIAKRTELDFSGTVDGEHYSVNFSYEELKDRFSDMGVDLDDFVLGDGTKTLLALSKESLSTVYGILEFAFLDVHLNPMKKSSEFIVGDSLKAARAVQLVCELVGRNTTIIKTFKGYTVKARSKGYISLKKSKRDFSRITDVFCLTTHNSNFIIRQNGIVTITGNCVYGAGGAKIAESLGVSKAEGDALVEGYWKVNWSVTAIAEEQTIIEANGLKWLINPINGMLYNIRSEKDIFSTLAQGSGAFLFDMWINEILDEMKSRWNRATLTGQFHDEVILSFKDSETNRKMMEDLVRVCLDRVSEKFKLRRKLGCDVQFGKRYSEIH